MSVGVVIHLSDMGSWHKQTNKQLSVFYQHQNNNLSSVNNKQEPHSHEIFFPLQGNGWGVGMGGHSKQQVPIYTHIHTCGVNS